MDKDYLANLNINEEHYQYFETIFGEDINIEKFIHGHSILYAKENEVIALIDDSPRVNKVYVYSYDIDTIYRMYENNKDEGDTRFYLFSVYDNNKFNTLGDSSRFGNVGLLDEVGNIVIPPIYVKILFYTGTVFKVFQYKYPEETREDCYEHPESYYSWESGKAWEEFVDTKIFSGLYDIDKKQEIIPCKFDDINLVNGKWETVAPIDHKYISFHQIEYNNSTNNPFYDDNLDMDQQSEDFWQNHGLF